MTESSETTANLLLDESLDSSARAEKLLPLVYEGQNAHHLHNLARCHFLLGDLDRALDIQRRAASLLPPGDENNANIIRQRLAEYEAAAEQ